MPRPNNYSTYGLNMIQELSGPLTPEKGLIAAILVQAFCDFNSTRREDESYSAKRFIDKDNLLFIYYCDHLDIDPEYLAGKMHAALRKGHLKSLKRFKE